MKKLALWTRAHRVLPLVLVTAGLASLANACQGDDPYPCVKEAAVSGSTDRGDGIGQVQQPLYVRSATIWDNDDHTIPVCWEGNTWSIQTDADRAIVKNAVDNTWAQALDFELVPEANRVRFTGWGQCNSSSNNGIRITVPYGDKDNPHATALGKKLAGKRNGIVLNFDFTKWNEWCSLRESDRQYCIYVIAVHEFGHALGFAHEQNRPDTDREACTDAPQGTDGDILMGPWDQDSVMNYCNPNWNGGGALSDGDLLGVRAAYYPDLYDFKCVGEFKQRNPVLRPSPTPSPRPGVRLPL